MVKLSPESLLKPPRRTSEDPADLVKAYDYANDIYLRIQGLSSDISNHETRINEIETTGGGGEPPTPPIPTFDPFLITETNSQLVSAGSALSGFNGYTMMCREFVVPSIGTVTQIGLRYPTAINWRPKLLRGVTPRQGGSYRVIYSHPALVAYPGGGAVQWIDLFTPAEVWACGPVWVAAFFDGAAGGTSGPNTLAVGRAEIIGDPTFGTIAMGDYSTNPNEDAFETPALSVRCQGNNRHSVYFTDFNIDGLMDGWGTAAINNSVANSVFSGDTWTFDDPNHVPNLGTNPADDVGVLTLILFKEGFEHCFPGPLHGTPIAPVTSSDFSGGARLTFRARGTAFNIHEGKWRVWLQCRHPDDPTKYANFMSLTIDNSSMLADGNWHIFDQVLSTNPEDWKYAAGHLDLYKEADFTTAIKTLSNFHLPIVRADGSPQPEGTIEVDYIGISYRSGD